MGFAPYMNAAVKSGENLISLRTARRSISWVNNHLLSVEVSCIWKSPLGEYVRVIPVRVLAHDGCKAFVEVCFSCGFVCKGVPLCNGV